MVENCNHFEKVLKAEKLKFTTRCSLSVLQLPLHLWSPMGQSHGFRSDQQKVQTQAQQRSTPDSRPKPEVCRTQTQIRSSHDIVGDKFESGARPGTWSNRLLKFRCKSIIKEC
jgi:hypothetical protein